MNRQNLERHWSARAHSRARTCRQVLIAAPLLLLLSSCVVVDPEADYEQAREAVSAAVGAGSYFSEAEGSVDQQVRKLIENGLTAQESVRTALLNNRELQALFLEIGISRADAVQAGLLSNPSLGALIRLPVDGGKANVEAGIAQNLAELWYIPARKRFAEKQVERTVLEVASRAVRLAAQAKRAYYSAAAAEAALAVAKENLGTVRELLELTTAGQAAGAATEVEVNAARSELLEQEVIVRSAELERFESKRRLLVVLGLERAPGEVELSEALSAPPAWDVSLKKLLALSREHRLDLRAAGKKVEAAEHALDLERRLFLRNASAGVALETEGSDTALGPSVEVDLPIFDQNQAQIAKAKARYVQAQRSLEALTISAVQEVRGAHERFQVALDTARLYQDRLLPLRQSSLELARESFAAGKTGFLSVLQAQGRLLAARRDYVGRLELVALSIPEMEAACGRPLEDLLETDDSEARGSEGGKK